MAGVHVRCWQETYRGLMPDAVLDDSGLPAARERMWTAVLTDERYRQNRVAVAVRDAEMIGSRCLARPRTPRRGGPGSCMRCMCTLPSTARALGGRCWRRSSCCSSRTMRLADPNPRAQAFYRKHGFVADGTAQVHAGVRAIRMVRDEQHCGTGRAADVRQVV